MENNWLKTFKKRFKRKKSKKKSEGFLKDTVNPFLEVGMLFTLITTFLFQPFTVPSGSMEETIMTGDKVLVNKFIYGANSWDSKLFPYRKLQRGDIIVFRSLDYETMNTETKLVKRLIGLPGDVIEVKNKIVYVNGEKQIETYTRYHDAPAKEQPEIYNYGPFEVPKDHFFAMGDHRNNSHDSRFFGARPISHIEAQVTFIWWSFDLESISGPDANYSHAFSQTVLDRYNPVFHHHPLGENFYHTPLIKILKCIFLR